MFKEAVTATALSDGYAESALGFVNNATYGFGYESDVSMLSTLRALLKDRIGSGERVGIWWGTIDNYATINSDDNSSWRSVARLINSGANLINVMNVESRHDRVFAVSEKKLPEIGYEKIEKVTAFFRKSFRIDCFVNYADRNTVVLVENMDLRKFHFIQCCITLFLPWYFKPEEKLKDEEIRLVKSLTGDSVEEYLDSIRVIAEGFGDMRTFAIDKMLSGFERRIYERRTDAIKSAILSADRSIERLKTEMEELIKKRRDKAIELFGWEHARDESESRDLELRSYFINNKHVDIADTDGRIVFTTKGYLSMWEDEPVDSIINYDRSGLYTTGLVNKFSKEDRKLLATAIFKDRSIKLRICSAYYIDIEGASMGGINSFNYPASYADYMPNPHIDKFRCIGQYEQIFNECVQNGNYIMAVDQAIMSSASINMIEGMVFNELFDRMFGRSCTKKYLELPDGRCVDTDGAIKYLREVEGTNGTTD